MSALFSTAQKLSYILPISANRPPVPAFKAASLLKNENERAASSHSIIMLNQNYYTQHLGFMCKKELALEKITKVPLRFRLGSLQQCNYLEGKK